jgi:hypothetical protein
VSTTRHHRPDRSPAWNAVYATLREYGMPNMADEDGLGPYPLVDLMSREGETIADGEAQMAELADEICYALWPDDAAADPSPFAPGAGQVVLVYRPHGAGQVEVARVDAVGRVTVSDPAAIDQLPLREARALAKALALQLGATTLPPLPAAPGGPLRAAGQWDPGRWEQLFQERPELAAAPLTEQQKKDLAP